MLAEKVCVVKELFSGWAHDAGVIRDIDHEHAIAIGDWGKPVISHAAVNASHSLAPKRVANECDGEVCDQSKRQKEAYCSGIDSGGRPQGSGCQDHYNGEYKARVNCEYAEPQA